LPAQPDRLEADPLTMLTEFQRQEASQSKIAKLSIHNLTKVGCVIGLKEAEAPMFVVGVHSGAPLHSPVAAGNPVGRVIESSASEWEVQHHNLAASGIDPRLDAQLLDILRKIKLREAHRLRSARAVPSRSEGRHILPECARDET
jgi:hypothetical protein